MTITEIQQSIKYKIGDKVVRTDKTISQAPITITDFGAECDNRGRLRPCVYGRKDTQDYDLPYFLSEIEAA